MSNIVPTWKNKALSSKEEQGMALVSPVSEVELTDEQLAAICGGQKCGRHEHDDWNYGHHEHDDWNYGHYEQDGWNYGHHERDRCNHYKNNGWSYCNHH